MQVEKIALEATVIAFATIVWRLALYKGTMTISNATKMPQIRQCWTVASFQYDFDDGKVDF